MPQCNVAMHFQGRLSVITEEYLLWTNKNKDYAHEVLLHFPLALIYSEAGT